MDNTGNKIRILKFEPQQLPYEKEIVYDWQSVQEEVEGLFECVYLDNNCILVCNDEGKLNGMELNRRVGNDIVAGPFFIVGDSKDGDFISLTDNQIKQYTEQLGQIQEFTGEEPEAQPRIEFIGFEF